MLEEPSAEATVMHDKSTALLEQALVSAKNGGAASAKNGGADSTAHFDSELLDFCVSAKNCGDGLAAPFKQALVASWCCKSAKNGGAYPTALLESHLLLSAKNGCAESPALLKQRW